MGNPNSGKSTIFSRLTGISVITSNYPGTTVEFYKGYINLHGERYEIIDVPGTYSLEPTNKAEEVAVKMYNEGSDIVINVVDATNLERNLGLTFQLLNGKTPVIVILNFWDETKHYGVEIDIKKLEELLGVPVVATCGRTGEGIKELVERLKEAKISKLFLDKNKWEHIGRIVSQVQKLTHRHHTFLDRLNETTIRPSTGIPFALLVFILTFVFVRFIGEGLISWLEPIFENYYQPFITKFIEKIVGFKPLKNLLLGTGMKAMESFGILTTGLYIPFVIVLPYIISFYFVLSLLEDIGYLPRLAVMFDTFLHKLGVHGYSAISIMLGFGCKVPGILATRLLETTKEKIIATVLVLSVAPCMPQTAMIITLLNRFRLGVIYVILVFSIFIFISVMNCVILNKIIKAEISELFLEIPPYRMPYLLSTLKKLWMRIKLFITDAVPLIILGVFILSILDILGVLNFITNNFGFVVTTVLGLPKETIGVILLGFLRKDVSIGLLIPYNLTVKESIVASVFLTLYLPCIATFLTIQKELGFKSIIVVILMLLAGITVSTILNLVL